MRATSWVLALACVGLGGCLDDKARPLDEFLGQLPDSGGGMAEAPDAAPDAARGPGMMCSPSTITEAQHVRFENGASAAVSLFRVDPSCTEVLFALLQPNEAREQDSFIGDVWRMRLQDGTQKEYVITADTTVIRFTVP